MKLLYVENTLANHGGIERVITDKLNWLVEYGGCEVCLLGANQGTHPIVFPLNPNAIAFSFNVKNCSVSVWPLGFRHSRQM